MVKAIHKYTLRIQQSAQAIPMPISAKVLAFQLQGEEPYRTPCIWAEVDEHEGLKDRNFLIIGTGWEVPPGGIYRGTVQDRDYVWHLYEQGNTEVKE